MQKSGIAIPIRAVAGNIHIGDAAATGAPLQGLIDCLGTGSYFEPGFPIGRTWCQLTGRR